MKIEPPSQGRSVGRPKTVRIPPVGEFKPKYRCSCCLKKGHNKASYRNKASTSSGSMPNKKVKN